MISRVKRKIASRISNMLRSIGSEEIENALPLAPQLIEFQECSEEEKQSFYDHTKDPLGSINFYEDLRDRLVSAGIPVESIHIDMADFKRWVNRFSKIKRFYKNMGNALIEKCLEHYLAFKYLNISAGDIYIDIASSGSPWSKILNSQVGIKSYRLDLSFPEGINGTNIGAEASHTKLPGGFASVLSLQCAYECFMGDADINFIQEASRVIGEKGRYGIVPLYLADVHFVSTSPYCNQTKVVIEPEAKKVWRDDKYKEPFSRHYSPESFAERIYSTIPDDMEGKILYFKNLGDMMRHYTGQRIYCFFMFLCEKKNLTQENSQ